MTVRPNLATQRDVTKFFEFAQLIMLLFQDEHGNEIQEISYDKSWLVQKWYEFDVKYPFQ